MTPFLLSVAVIAAAMVLAGVIAEAWEIYDARRDSLRRNRR
jgi:hypothetical protein